MPATLSDLPTPAISFFLARAFALFARYPKTWVRLGVLLLLATMFIAMPRSAYAAGDCFATADDGITTPFNTTDSQAVRDAIADAVSNGYDTVKIAGYCAGVQFDLDFNSTQLGIIDGELTLIGGYTATDWSASYPLTQPTTLDAVNGGRVIYATQPVTVTNLIVQNGLATSGNGGGIYAAASLSLSGATIISNTASGNGGGVQADSGVNVQDSQFLGNRSTSGEGGAVSASGASQIIDSHFAQNQGNSGGAVRLIAGTGVVQGSYFTANVASQYGGGVYADNLTLAMTTTSLVSNTTGLRGGGTYVRGDVLITGTTFVANTAGYGAGLYVEGLATITGTDFLGNAASQYGGGLVLAISFAGPYAGDLAESDFLSNTAGIDGGGVYAGVPVQMAGMNFVGNSAAGSGGGVVLGSNASSITATTFTSNRAAYGGAGYLNAYDLSVQNSRFTGNSATNEGGALFGYQVNNLALRANQLLRNSAVDGGGALYFSLSDNAQLENNIFAGNSSTNNGQDIDIGSESEPSSIFGQHNTFVSAASGGGPSIIVGREFSGQSINLQHGIFHGYGVAVQSGPNPSGATLNGVLWSSVLTPTEQLGGGAFTIANDYTGSAAFVNAAADDYHLSISSAAINRAMGSTTPTDFEGEVRPQQSVADLGADESPYLAGVCFATADNGATLRGSYDSQAVRDAIADAVATNASTVKLAGYCQGTVYDSDTDNWQVASITIPLTLLGGYTQTDWSVAYPITQPTTLDADYEGRVIYATADLDVQGFTVLHGTTGSGVGRLAHAPRLLAIDYDNGGGIYASAAVTLTNMSILENETCACGNAFGGGVFAPSIVAVNSLVQHNLAFAGGGLAAFDPNFLMGLSPLRPSEAITGVLVMTNSQIVENFAFGAGGAFALYADISASQFVSNEAVAIAGGLGAFVADVRQTRFEANMANSDSFGPMPLHSERWAAFKAMRALAPNRVLPFANQPQAVQNSFGGGGAFVGLAAITDSTFISNTSAGIAGGMFVAQGSLINTDFIANATVELVSNPQVSLNAPIDPNEADTATGGAGLACARQILGSLPTVNGVPDLVIVGGRYISNTSAGSGGGLYAECDVSIEESQFMSNTAHSAGGGLYVTNAEFTWITQTEFINNVVLPYDDGGQIPQRPSVVTAGEGGGAFVRVISDSVTGVSINRSFFADNSASMGGGLALYNAGVADLSNNVFARNQASDGQGSALKLAGAMVNLLHNSIADASVNAASAIEWVTGTLGITDTIVTSHTVGISASLNTVVVGSHNLFFGNGSDVVGVAILVNTVNGDPRFANPSAIDADGFRSSPNSIAVDGGLDIGIKNDYADDPRPIGNGPDIGAFETSAAAELGIGGFATPNSVRPGEPLTISVVAVNTGPNIAYDVVITIAVGTGMTAPVCQSIPACVTDGQLMTVTLAQLAVNDTHTIAISGIADPAIQDDTVIVASAGVQALRDVNSGNNDAVVRANVAVIADIAVGKWAQSPTVLAGQRITYTAVITNLGPGVAHNVLFTDALPGAIQALQCQAAGSAVCTVSFGKAILNLASLAVNATQIVTLSGQTSQNTVQGTVLVNTADGSAANDSTVINNTASASVTVQTLADLHLSISDAPDPVSVGGLVAYVISVTNSGPNPARNVSVGGVQTGGSILGTSASQGNCSALPCVLGTLGVNATAYVTVAVTAPGVAGVISHNAVATTDTPLVGAAPAATAQTTVSSVASADVVVSKRVSSSSVVAGARVTYTLVITNLGPSAAQSVRVTDVLTTALQAITCSSTGGGVCVMAGNTVVVTFGSLPVNQAQTILIAATVRPDVSGGTVLTNGVALRSTTPDANIANGGGGLIIAPPEATVTVRAESDLSATIQHVGGLSVNQPAKFEILVTNMGPSHATAVTVTANLPAGFVFGSSTPVFVAESANAVWNCSASGQVVTCRTASMAVSAVDRIVLNVNVTDGAPVQATTSVAVSSGSTDPNLANNTGNDTAAVDRPTAIVLERFVVAGKQVQWTTSAEVNTYGFHVLRSKTGSRVDAEVITPAMIAAQGRQGGASYVFEDVSADPAISYTYWLQEIELDGDVLEYGPAVAGVGHVSQVSYALFVPLLGRE